MRWLNSENMNVSGMYQKPILPIRGKQLAHDEKASCPMWASTLPVFCSNDMVARDIGDGVQLDPKPIVIPCFHF